MKRAMAGLLFLIAVSPAEASVSYGVLPPADEVFRGLIADPRQARTTVRYYRLAGHNAGDVALGNTWGLARWEGGDWLLQSSVEGMGYSRFLVSGGINEFEAIDFFMNLPLEFRSGSFSGRASLFHESSHLGDDHVRRTGDRGFRYSVEGFGLVLSRDFGPHARLYGGGTALLHQIPTGQDGAAQAGLELRSQNLDWNWLPAHECWAYLGQDVQWKGRSGWNANSNTELGMRIGVSRVARAVRVHLNYFEGHSEFGQFFAEKEQFTGFGATFD
ncbi:MAG: hypothetical protein CO113_16195, partial [Elusimicrobia bacterium CG_4_9_14_3_um_filter_62_55]